MKQFKIFQKIKRPIDVFDESKGYKFGIVLSVYDYTSKRFGYYEELYEVQWNYPTPALERAFLPHGLQSV